MTSDRPRATLGSGHGRPVEETRAAIVAYLEGHEAATVEAIAGAMRLTEEATAKHLRELRAERRVQSAGYGPTMWLVAPRPVRHRAPAPTPAWAATDDRIVAWLDEQDEPVTASTVAAALCLDPTGVLRHLARMDGDRALCVGVEASESRRRYGARLWVAGPVPEGWER